MMMHEIKLIRVYDHTTIKNAKGYKVLVDRLWPRGVAKADLPYEWWLKELAPSNELRSWFNHEDERYQEFKEKYLKEIAENPIHSSVLKFLKVILQDEDVILMYGAKNEKYNQAVVLKEWLEKNN